MSHVRKPPQPRKGSVGEPDPTPSKSKAVKGYPAIPPPASLGRRMLAGAMGSCTAEAGTMWLDTVKVRYS